MIVVGLTCDGMLIAAQAPTVSAALGELTDQFGEGVAALYAHVQVQLTEQMDAEVCFPREVAAPVSSQELSGQQRLFEDFALRAGAATDQVPSAPATEDDGGTEETSPGPSPEVRAVESDPSEEEVQDGQRCALCERSVTTDLAELSVDKFGEVRCFKCGIWN